jgi:hypothetical protein
MPAFARGQTILSNTPFMPVSAGMSAGTYAWRLEVIDTAGNVSAPAQVTVTIYSTIITKPWVETEPLPPPPGPVPEEM